MAPMNKIKHELCLKQWEQLINQRIASGMSIKDWCTENSISKDAYYYWLRLLRERATEQLPVEVKNSLTAINQTDDITFKKLEVKSPVTGFQTAVVIHLPSATLEINNGADQRTVEAVLLALKSYAG